jgi:carbon-monoxide dehydrogenase medium subunit
MRPGAGRERSWTVLLVLPEFDILATDTVEETCALLHHYGDDTRVLAGGTDLLVKMKHRRLLPRQLINIKRIRDLGQIHDDDGGGLRIGTLATVQSIKDSPVIAKKFPLLNQAAGMLGTLQIRHLATLGGNLANASPSAEFAPVLLTLDAAVKCTGHGGERVIPVDEFFLGPGKCALRQDELLTEVQVPNFPADAAGFYLKHALRRMDVAVAAAAVVVRLDGDVCRDVKIALGAVAPTPFRARKAEAALAGQRLDGGAGEQQLCEEVGRLAADESLPIDDFRGYAGYRREVVAGLVGRALGQVIAQNRARGGRTSR